ncbi:MAG: DNA repair protein RecO [Pseudomonadales bacterium]|jgi:DNA repair protein RecO (recombination protein O)|uniref:DNA repair protein RecO n=1 Tax=unclassified Ketobacter TaxID=2639109 RepID=UPI000C5D05BF|nr:MULTISPECIES: DNA repair protein RecO [unclassified Ketobacter]MAA58817.1 DNA repair protein RecO [Pseudomonadales bacterium]MEC8813664.1 DNA repair protein RecO [Pseudomonadota bacterium]TNC89613.1 MAG: DNA repair protein RecO [Alcanivorax sp.]HAU13310.1 DNA repair protein RecO [Gammaproteobacteria bacterium]MAQ27147.1 DNA repair protein RecO [Pseudomonadales bacterium]|tara:strand:- start:48 stop:764 length:717 start_codon:yes stop_codon:yes gene_type:complete
MANTDLGYLLHSRPYRDSSVICDFLLEHHGRASLLYRGVRKAGKQGAKGRLLQPFSPLAVTFDGRNELKTGRLLEPAGAPVFLVGRQLYSGLYVNELLVRLLHKEEPASDLFRYYQNVITELRNGQLEATLRRFERILLAELGYELSLQWDVHGQPLQVDQLYLYEPDQGFLPVATQSIDPGLRQRCFTGQHLLAINRHAYDDQAVALAAKKLSRQALAPHLGDKPLRSRELFKQSAQ